MVDIQQRCLSIGKRIREERTNRKWSQELLGEKMAVVIGGNAIPSNTISGWENGKVQPPMDKLFALAQVFECDIGYLLCDYDEPIHGEKEICELTGLSMDSVRTLCFLKKWDLQDSGLSSVIDALIFDYSYMSKDAIKQHQPLVHLLYWFLNYKPVAGSINETWTAVSINDEFIDYPKELGSSPDYIRIEGIVENAALMEIQQALLDLKSIYKPQQTKKK